MHVTIAFTEYTAGGENFLPFTKDVDCIGVVVKIPRNIKGGFNNFNQPRTANTCVTRSPKTSFFRVTRLEHRGLLGLASRNLRKDSSRGFGLFTLGRGRCRGLGFFGLGSRSRRAFTFAALGKSGNGRY